MANLCTLALVDGENPMFSSELGSGYSAPYTVAPLWPALFQESDLCMLPIPWDDGAESPEIEHLRVSVEIALERIDEAEPVICEQFGEVGEKAVCELRNWLSGTTKRYVLLCCAELWMMGSPGEFKEWFAEMLAMGKAQAFDLMFEYSGGCMEELTVDSLIGVGGTGAEELGEHSLNQPDARRVSEEIGREYESAISVWPRDEGPYDGTWFADVDLSPPLTLRWRREICSSGNVDPGIVGGDGRVYVSEGKSAITAVDLQTGDMLWNNPKCRDEMPASICGRYLFSQYMGSEGLLLDSSNGEEVCRCEAPGLYGYNLHSSVLTCSGVFGLESLALTSGEPFGALLCNEDYVCDMSMSMIKCMISASLEQAGSVEVDGFPIPIGLTGDLLLTLENQHIQVRRVPDLSAVSTIGTPNPCLCVLSNEKLFVETEFAGTGSRSAFCLLSGERLWSHPLREGERSVGGMLATRDLLWGSTLSEKKSAVRAYSQVSGEVVYEGEPGPPATSHLVVDDCLLVNRGKELLCFEGI